jgi:ParB family transcriptional regulator, chromosome partitioning protein
MAMRKHGLGKGLSALLAGKEEVEEGLPGDVQVAPVAGGVALIPLSQITTNPYQPRTEFDEQALEDLADSIRLHGIIQPITLRFLSPGKYELISGERRFRASHRAGLTEVPAYVRAAADAQAMLEMALIENIHREDLNAMEVALSYQRLIDECQLTQEQLSERVAKKRSTITNYLRLLRLPVEIQSGIIEGKITMGHARALVAAGSDEAQLRIYRLILAKGLSVRQTEAMVSQGESASDAPTEKGRAVSYKLEVPGLSERIKGTVRVQNDGKGGGKITIPFLSPKERDAIIAFLDK